jgi:AcrR family transcriptional regulator
VTSTVINGHAARAQRTRKAIIDALVELLSEGIPNPSAAEIAARAEISKRSIFVHYATLDDLYREVAARATEMVLAIVAVIDPDAPFDRRVAELCRQRAKVHEAIGPLRQAATARANTSKVIASSQQFAQRSSRDQITRVFAKELARYRHGARRRVVAAVDAVLSGTTWDLWRGFYGFGEKDARLAMQGAVTALLTG